MHRTALMLLLVAGCGAAESGPGPPPTASPVEVAVLCERYAEVANLSRQEVMLSLIDVAPSEILGPIKRASELGGSFEDDRRIDEYLNRCTTVSGDR